jgi:hypothetical protein
MFVIAVMVAMVTVTVGIVAVVSSIHGSDGNAAEVNPGQTGFTPGGGSPAPTPTVPVGGPATTPVAEPTPVFRLDTLRTPTTEAAPPDLLTVAPPAFEALTEGLARVRNYYSEEYQIDVFTIRWRPGAFPPERAEQVAAQARIGLDEVNRQLGTHDNGPLEILLADRMYAEECTGCQGFAASDLRQVFILQDGSMSDDEFQALLTHEIGHVIAGNYIALPHSLFFAEGLATWLMTPDLVAEGYIEPTQIAAWAYAAGILPSLEELLDARFEGRTRARLEYDPAASFTRYVIETYGMELYKRLYDLEPPEDALERDWATLEAEWHAWLDQWAGNVVNGVDGHQWWQAAGVVIQAFDRLYADPGSVSEQQYAQLATARVALNRGDIDTAVHLARASGLVPTTAH